MDTIAKYLGENKDEFSATVAGCFFVLLLLLLKEVNTDILASISVFERVGGVLVFSYVLGRLGNVVGNMISKLIVLASFDQDRKNFPQMFLDELKKHLSSGPKWTEDNEYKILHPEVIQYIERYPGVALENSKRVSSVTFWDTFLGCSVVMLLFTWNSASNFIIYVNIGGLVLLLLPAVFARHRAATFWYEICSAVGRKEKVND